MTSDAETPAKGRKRTTSGGISAELTDLGKYHIEKKLGSGGMGTVYLAKDTQLRRTVALKVLPRDKAENPTLVRRFKAEAQAAAQLRHDNIVTVFETGEADGYLYIAMEFVDGVDLHEVIARRGPIPVPRSIEMVRQVASALQHAFENKIVHRDIKPSNLLLRRDGAIKLTDLGLARSVDDTIETGITRAGTTVGTVDYMAPEQARNSQLADIRSDIYSLGCTWYHMLTGTAPFPEGSMTNKLQAHAIKPPPDPRQMNDQVADGLVAVMHRMMAKKPQDRYQTPQELLDDLKRSTLTKGTIASEILDDEDDDRHSVSAGHDTTILRAETTGAVPKTPRQQGTRPLMPPKRKSLSEDEPAPKDGINLEVVKYVAIVAGAVAVFGGLGWLVSNVGGVMGGPGELSPQAASVAQPDPGQMAADAAVEDASQLPAGDEAGPGSGQMIDGDAATATTGTSGAGSSAPLSSDALLKRPAWLDQPAATALAEFVVGDALGQGRRFETLDEALRQVPKEGAHITLSGNRPFVIEEAHSLVTSGLTLTAQPNQQALVLVRGAAVQGLRVNGGVCRLERLNLTWERGDAAPPVTGWTSLLTVREGSLWIVDCCLTVNGSSTSLGGAAVTGNATAPVGSASAAAGVAILAIEPHLSQPERCRVLVQRSLLRGSQATGVSVRAPIVDVAIEDSVLATGQQPAVLIASGTAAPGGNTAARSGRVVRIMQSALCSQQAIFDLTGDAAASQAQRLDIVIRDSVCSATDREGRRVMANADGWAQDALRGTIGWTIQDSLLLGFQNLLDLGARSSFKVTDGPSWQIFWKTPVSLDQFQSQPWPTGLGSPDQFTATVFDREQVPVRTVLTSSGSFPGVNPSRVATPQPLTPGRLTAALHRQSLPADVVALPTAIFRKVDLKRDDLGAILSATDWPDDAVFEAVGHGVCTMSPAIIQNRKVHVVFRQGADPAPLRLTPKESAIRNAAALFQLTKATLDVQGLRYAAPEPKGNASQPAWLVTARDSHVVFRHCELLGPDKPGTPFEGLVRFETSATAGTTPSFLVSRDSFWSGPGTLISVLAGPAAIHLRNSVMTSQGTVCVLQPVAMDNQLPMTLEVVQCTLAARRQVFEVKPASLTVPATTPVRCFVDRTIFAEPAGWKPADGPVSVLVMPPIGSDQKQLEWWGQHNAISPLLSGWLAIVSNTPPESAEAWLTRWGTEGEQHLLTSRDGVIWAQPLPKRPDLVRPDTYRLLPTAKAATWADGQPIGADLGALTSRLGPQSAAAPATSAKPAAPSQPGGTTKPKPLSTKPIF
jgi:eukaryotic-like serine/threonine-protein kinase